MKRWIACIAGIVAGLLLAAMPGRAGEGLRIVDLRFGMYQDRVRLILGMTGRPVFTAFHLNNPDRLVIDLPRATWAVPEDATGGLPYVSAIRHGLFRPDRTRLVLDLIEPVRIERVHVQPGRDGIDPRLILDISPTTRAAFDAGAGWPEGARWRQDRPDPARTPDLFVVAIDPGHGGVDPGARGRGLVEKTVVLEFARKLAAEIDAMPGYRAMLTRDDDSFLPLSERVARAHRAGAGVMLSIHADVLEEGEASGVSVYTLAEEASDRAATMLAERENRTDVLAGADLGGESDDLARLLIELAQRGTQPESEKLAADLLAAIDGETKLLRTRPHRRANFRVLKAPDIPSVLLELGFMNSDADRERLSSPEWHARIAARVALGIDAWRKRASPGYRNPR